MPKNRSLALFGIVILLCVSDLAAAPEYIIKPRLLGNHVVGEVRRGAGVACYRDGKIGPPSYLMADLGKSNVPRIPDAEMALLRKRFSNLAPRTLRFVRLALPEPRIVVFNASLSELCDPTKPPFKDLLGPCNQYYSPLEGMDRTTAAPSCP